VGGGWISVENGRIAAIGSDPAPDAIDLGRTVILPALVNAHTHLELSYLHGSIPPAPGFGQWVRAVMSTRRQYPDPADARIVGPARAAIAGARAAGTGLFGDVSNTLVTVPLLRESGSAAQVFHELTGFTEQDPVARVREARGRADALAAAGEGVRISIAPHAPYSVSAALFQAIRADLDAHPHTVSSVHLGETPEEVELLRHGTGEIKAVLEELGRWPADWRAPGVGPVDYLADLGVLDARMLVVHGVQFDGDDLTRLRAMGMTLISCPRSNVHVGVGSPPLEVFYAMDVDVAFGTDSLASVADLNVFSELKEARRLAPRVPAGRLLESATLTGARALGFEREFGSLEAGKRAALIAVRVPEGVVDVEEYLLTGIEPAAITWVDPGTPSSRFPTST
jgi:cytosine/adenosine deaminase-related metal-dependent hydrolase